MSDGQRPTVYLHVGVPLTGASLLHQVMSHQRNQLRDDGVLYPGGTNKVQYLASLDLRGATHRGKVQPNQTGAWARLVDVIGDWSGRVVISQDSLAAATESQVDRALADLSFADIHLVVTVRDLTRQLPAAWQEHVRNRGTASWAEFVDTLRGGPEALPAGSEADDPSSIDVDAFWAEYAPLEVLRRWSRALAPERVHVVTVPPAGADPILLWERFAQVIGVDPARITADDAALEPEPRELSATETAVLRAVNVRVADNDIPWPVYTSAFRNGLDPSGSVEARPIELPMSANYWSKTRTTEVVEGIERAGYHVVGDLKDLELSTSDASVDPDDVSADDRLSVALAGMRTLAELAIKDPREARIRKRSRNTLIDDSHEPVEDLDPIGGLAGVLSPRNRTAARAKALRAARIARVLARRAVAAVARRLSR